MQEERTTVTFYPAEDLPGRYKKVMSTYEVIEAFIENRQHVAISANLYLDRGVLYSYGRHWPLARWCKNATGGPEFCLYRRDGGTVTTATKHRAPLVSALVKDARIKFCVDNVLAETETHHRDNYGWMVDRAESLARLGRRGPKALRAWKAWGAVDHLFVAFHYMNYATAGGFPTSDMPHAILRDWIEEKMPTYTQLMNACSVITAVGCVPGHSVLSAELSQ